MVGEEEALDKCQVGVYIRKWSDEWKIVSLASLDEMRDVGRKERHIMYAFIYN